MYSREITECVMKKGQKERKTEKQKERERERQKKEKKKTIERKKERKKNKTAFIVDKHLSDERALSFSSEV